MFGLKPLINHLQPDSQDFQPYAVPIQIRLEFTHPSPVAPPPQPQQHHYYHPAIVLGRHRREEHDMDNDRDMHPRLNNV